jgi:hypothetical protein
MGISLDNYQQPISNYQQHFLDSLGFWKLEVGSYLAASTITAAT